jgi:cell division septum initiation protein DivIVA
MNMTDSIAFQVEQNGYAIGEVDTYVQLLLDNYNELLSHYEARTAEIETLNTKVAELDARPAIVDHNEEVLELLNETAKVVTAAKASAKTQITALIDQASLHAMRLEKAVDALNDELAKMRTTADNQF